MNKNRYIKVALGLLSILTTILLERFFEKKALSYVIMVITFIIFIYIVSNIFYIKKYKQKNLIVIITLIFLMFLTIESCFTPFYKKHTHYYGHKINQIDDIYYKQEISTQEYISELEKIRDEISNVIGKDNLEYIVATVQLAEAFFQDGQDKWFEVLLSCKDNVSYSDFSYIYYNAKLAYAYFYKNDFETANKICFDTIEISIKEDINEVPLMSSLYALYCESYYAKEFLFLSNLEQDVTKILAFGNDFFTNIPPIDTTDFTTQQIIKNRIRFYLYQIPLYVKCEDYNKCSELILTIDNLYNEYPLMFSEYDIDTFVDFINLCSHNIKIEIEEKYIKILHQKCSLLESLNTESFFIDNLEAKVQLYLKEAKTADDYDKAICYFNIAYLYAQNYKFDKMNYYIVCIDDTLEKILLENGNKNRYNELYYSTLKLKNHFRNHLNTQSKIDFNFIENEIERIERENLQK